MQSARPAGNNCVQNTLMLCLLENMHLCTCQCLLTCVCFVLQEQDSLFRFIALELCQATLHEVGLVAIEFSGSTV